MECESGFRQCRAAVLHSGVRGGFLSPAVVASSPCVLTLARCSAFMHSHMLQVQRAFAIALCGSAPSESCATAPCPVLIPLFTQQRNAAPIPSCCRATPKKGKHALLLRQGGPAPRRTAITKFTAVLCEWPQALCARTVDSNLSMLSFAGLSAMCRPATPNYATESWWFGRRGTILSVNPHKTPHLARRSYAPNAQVSRKTGIAGVPETHDGSPEKREISN